MPNTKNNPNVSRREFLKQAGIALGGITLVSLGTTTSCGEPTPTSSSNTSSTPPTNTSSTQPSNTTSTTPPVVYPDPPKPELMLIPSCYTHVALDRKYTSNHIWVYPLQDNLVQIGVTESFHEIVYVIRYNFTKSVGSVLSAAREDEYCYVEGGKICTDLITPVSGTIISINTFHGIEYSPLETYTSDWQAVIKLSNPDELNQLYTPQYYAYLEAPNWSGPIPPKY